MTAYNSPQRRRDRGGKEFSIKIKILSVLCVSAVSCYRLANPWFFFKENKGVVSGTSRLGRQNRMHTQLCLAILPAFRKHITLWAFSRQRCSMSVSTRLLLTTLIYPAIQQVAPSGLAPPQICLPPTLSGIRHTCTSTHAFACGLPLLSVALACGSPYALLQPFSRYVAATALFSHRGFQRRCLPSATVAAPFGRSRLAAWLSASLRAASVRPGLDFARYLCHKYQTAPLTSRAKPGTQSRSRRFFSPSPHIT